MGTTKSEIFTAKQNKLANLLKALAHPARIAIIQQLVKSKHCIGAEFVNELGLAQATISQHLKELKKIGIIKDVAAAATGITILIWLLVLIIEIYEFWPFLFKQA